MPEPIHVFCDECSECPESLELTDHAPACSEAPICCVCGDPR